MRRDMFHFDMKIEDNVAVFKSINSDQVVLVDSFDNHVFETRVGTIVSTVPAATITAKNSEELNAKLEAEFNL